MSLITMNLNCIFIINEFTSINGELLYHHGKEFDYHYVFYKLSLVEDIWLKFVGLNFVATTSPYLTLTVFSEKV